MDQSDLNRVIRIVQSILPTYFDTESIAMDILVESWANHINEPSYSFIHNRCVDAIRDKHTERTVLESAAHETRPQPQEPSPEDRDSVNFLTAVLNRHEKRAVYYRFQLDLSQTETAERMNLGEISIRELIATAVFKMREAGQ